MGPQDERPEIFVMIMKVLLYNPKERRKIINPVLPLSLMVVATTMKKEGHDVKIVDGRIGEKLEDHLSNDIDMVGITSMTGSAITDAVEKSKMVKDFNQNIKVVWGGFHPSLLPEQTKKNPYIDDVCIGRYKPDDMLDYSIIDIEKYIRDEEGLRTIDYLSSRGCPHNCKFCSIRRVYGRKWDNVPLEKIEKDLEYLVEKYRINSIHFMDDNFFVNKERVEKICEIIKKHGWKLRIWAMCRCEYMVRFDDEFLKKLKKAGFEIINFGAESGSPKILEYMDKGITRENILESARVCKKHGFKTEYSFMIGLLNETDEDRELTYDIIDKLHEIGNSDIKLFMFTPFPGTELFDEAVKRGLEPPKNLLGWSKYEYENPITPWVPDDLKRKFKCATHVAWFAFTPDMERKYAKTPSKKVAYRILKRDALFRWKHRFFSLSPEWAMFKKVVSG